MILQRFLTTTLFKWDSVLFFTEIFLLLVGFLAGFAIIVAAIVGPTLVQTEKTTAQQNYVYEQSTK
jgi:cell division protein FtsI/penicillin-binding protein 2